MAKPTAKMVTAPVKTSVKKTSAKEKTTTNIEKVSEEILTKLKSLDLHQQLQADLEWCLGSYRFDQNTTGLLETIGKAHEVLKQAHANKAKGITSTLLSTIEKVLN